MKARAVIFPEANRFEWTDLTLPEPGPGDVLVKTLVTAISPGTERWTLRGFHLGTKFPCVPGYHRIGIVEQCGSDVTNLKVGDVVYGSSGRWEEENISCIFGAHVSHSVAAAGAYRLVDSTIPDPATLENMAFTILAGVGNRGIRFCEVQADEKVLIIGAGFVGICAAQLAALRGAHPVLLEKNPERAEFVRGIVPDVVECDDPELDAKLTALAPGGFDLLYDTVGHAATTDAMVQKTRRQGKLLLQAQYFDKEKCAIDLDQIKVKELTMKTTCGTDQKDFEDTLDNIREGRLKVAPTITHRFDAADALKGYELLHTGKPFNLGIVFHWDDRAKPSVS